MSIHFDKY